MLALALVLAGRVAAPASESKKRAHSDAAWQRLLVQPVGSSDRLPADWKVVPEPRDFRPRGGAAYCSMATEEHESAHELVQASSIVVLGVCVGNDGSFHRPDKPIRGSTPQYTTYYLRVDGYLKDATRRRAPFLKVLAPGGYLYGGQGGGDGIPFPYLDAGQRYLLYLKPNHGIDWGDVAQASSYIGRGDEYWTTETTAGRWFLKDGKLNGAVVNPAHWSDLGMGQPLERAIPTVQRAVGRERRGVPISR